MIRSHRPDLIILDLGLPDADGMLIIKEVRRKSTTPIIVVSARTDESDKVAALDAGADDYITKPPGGTSDLLGYAPRGATAATPLTTRLLQTTTG